MSENLFNLTSQDVQKLLADPSPDARAQTATKLASDFRPDGLSAAERASAEDIFRLMVQDAEVRVREALAESLKDNPIVPHDVARALAEDVDSVSIPVLKFSEVLTDADLIEIIQSQDESKQTAIAERKRVSQSVSGALVDSGSARVVTTLVANTGAEISEDSLNKVVTDFGADEAVQQAMAGRAVLPVTVRERLLTLVSDELRSALAARDDVSDTLASDLLSRSREKAVLGLGAEASEDELLDMVDQMFDRGRLTPSIVLRSICIGDMRFFEVAVAKLAGVPPENARLLIHDDGTLGLRAVFDKAGLPPGHFPAVQAAVTAMRETDYDGLENDRERYARRILELVLTQYGDLGVEFEQNDLEYLLTKMGELPADQIGTS